MKQPSTEGQGFISYRREESDALARLLTESLKAALPDWHFFYDFGSIEHGVDFKAVIEEGLDRADLLVVLIENNWAGARAGQPSRIFDDGDFVRYEVKRALERGIRVLPVLINDAKMPAESALPPDIARMRSINAVELRVSRFDADFAELVKTISGVPLRAPTIPVSTRLAWWATGALGAALFGLLGLYAQSRMTGGKALSDYVGVDGALIVSGVWVLLGVALGNMLAMRRR